MTQKLVVGLLVLTGVCAQHRVDPRNTYHRIICVAPLTGQGTASDPKRPLYAPWPGSSDPNGILAFRFELGDDGRHAVVEFVARTRSAFQAIFNDPTVTVFEKGVAGKAAIESAIQQYRKDFNLDTFELVMP